MGQMARSERGDAFPGTLAFFAVLALAMILCEIFITPLVSSLHKSHTYVGRVTRIDLESLTIQTIKGGKTVIRNIKNIDTYKHMLTDVHKEKKRVSILLDRKTRKFPPEDNFTIGQIVIIDP